MLSSLIAFFFNLQLQLLVVNKFIKILNVILGQLIIFVNIPEINMKTIYLVRHSKSSWENPTWSDQQRPLDKRGKRDAPLMASIMLLKEKKPELLISSHAKRAWRTAKMFQRIFMAN